MTREEIATMIEEIATEIGCDFAYHHFEEGQNPVLPFLVFDYPSDDNINADNSAYVDTSELNIYLCSDYVDFDSEAIIKRIMSENNLGFTANRDYIKKEYMYQTTFLSEVIING